MCLILDANCFSGYLNPADEDMAPVKKWVESKGRIAFSPTPKIKDELRKFDKMHRLMLVYSRDERLKTFPADEVEKKAKTLTDLCSNDAHIIALALVGKIKLLVSNDQKLGDDFKDKPKGKIYKHKGHKNLLTANVCR